MKEEYKVWISKFLQSVQNNCSGMAARACNEMVTAFPELTVVQGRVVESLHPVEQPHVWCQAPNGEIVDPTESQFSKILTYVVSPPPGLTLPARKPEVPIFDQWKK